MDLGDCLAAQARADKAVSPSSQALDLTEGLASARSRSALASIRPTLAAYWYRGVPDAALLEHRIQRAPIWENRTVTDTGLPLALDSHTLLVAAVIVHDRAVDPAELNVAGIIQGAWGVEAPNGFLTVVFVAHTWTGEPVNAEPHKHMQVTWFPIDRLPTDFVSHTRKALVSYLQGGPTVCTDGF